MAKQRLGFLLVVVAAAMAMSFILNVPKADAQISPLPGAGFPLVNPLPTGNVTNITGILSCLPLTGTGGINVTLQCGNITATATTNSAGGFILNLNSTITLPQFINGRCFITVNTPVSCVVSFVATLTSGTVTSILGLVIPTVNQVFVLLFNLINTLAGTFSAIVPVVVAT